MKFTLLYLNVLLLSFTLIYPLQVYKRHLLSRLGNKFDEAKSFNSELNNKGQIRNATNLGVTRSSAAGTISVSPSVIYDNDVTGGGAGINRTVTITNTGASNLSVSAVNITGADAGEFLLSGLPSLPATVTAGNSVSFSVAFNPSSTGIKTASIAINSDDAVNPVVSAILRGLGTVGLGGSNEPSLQSILNLYEIPVNVGDDDTSTNIINSSTLLQKAPILGEELDIQHFQKAGVGNVTITPLAVFGPTSNATVVGMGWYKSGNTSTSSELFTVSNNPLSNGQTVNVNYTGSLSFDPVTDTFGFYSRWPFFSDRHLYSEDALNTFSGSIPHHVRVFPYKDRSGTYVVNSYIVTFEENTSGFDYQDLIFIVQNVKPANPTSNALLFIENPDKFPANDIFVFSKVQIPWTRDSVTYNSNHDSLKVRIHNNGINPLIIRNIKLSNDTTWAIEKFNGAAYTPGAGLPKTVASGSFVDVILKFIARDQATRVKVLHETLTVISNDDKYPSKIVFLNGLWQKSGEGSHEPYAQEIIDAFGFTTKTGFVHTDLNLGDSTKLKGNEIKPSYFVRADTLLPVSIRQMGAYHTCCNSTERIQWYAKNSSTLNTVFTHIKSDAQTLLPRKSTTATASGTFIPTTAFGFKIGSNDYTDAAKNPGDKIAIRVWRVFDANGNIIPNAYIISNDYSGTSATNYDYNDNSHYVTNIKPEVGAALFSTLVSTPSNLDFGEKLLQASDSIPVSIKNTGQTYSDGSNDPVIKISSVQITGENSSEFAATMPPITTLTPQQVSSVKVKFKPVSEGLKIADLLIYYNSSLSPLRVPLYGIGKAPNTTVIVNNRIKAGSPTAVTINGKIWSSDTAYAFDNLQPFSNPGLSTIGATDEDSLYLREQSSNANKMPFRYEIPLPNGDYIVRLHFAEIVWGAPGGGFTAGAGSRVMNVKLENQYRLTNFDVVQEVGAAQALIKNLPVTITDGKLNIDFSATVDRPSVDAIEVYSFISSPLAEDVLDLKGTLINKDVVLEWVTINNVNTKYFEIQRSSNQNDFTTLGEIASNGQSSQLSKYNFTDNDPETSNNYYRVKEVDINGKITYSKIIRIDFADLPAMQIYPNPGKRKISISLVGIPNNQKTTLSIQTISGSTLRRIPLILSGEKIEVDVSSLKAGTYIISLSGKNFVAHKKFLKIN